MKSTFGYSPSKYLRSIGSVPSSSARVKTLMPAICVSGSSNDQTFPNSAPRNLLEAFADARSADADMPTLFATPELPVVEMTIQIRSLTCYVGIVPKARAGPSETRDLARRAINSLTVHSGLAARSSRCAFCSIARVGYRS